MRVFLWSKRYREATNGRGLTEDTASTRPAGARHARVRACAASLTVWDATSRGLCGRVGPPRTQNAVADEPDTNATFCISEPTTGKAGMGYYIGPWKTSLRSQSYRRTPP